jgi:hypothetical protein
MGTIRWYKRDPHRALVGMMHLTLEERGAYNTILDLIYINDGKLLDDAKFIATRMGIGIRVWKRLRARLMELGKIYAHGNFLRNEKADTEANIALARIAELAELGKRPKKKRVNFREKYPPNFGATIINFKDLGA